MSDLISRQAVLDKFQALCDACGEGDKYNGVMCRACALDDGICIVEDIPSAKPDMDEWCTECKEYDKEKHCCPRWNKVIRKTIKEVKAQYALEYPKIIHCEDCKWWDRLEDGHPYGNCLACKSGTQTNRWDIHIQRQCKYDFYCADAEPKEEDDNDK